MLALNFSANVQPNLVLRQLDTTGAAVEGVLRAASQSQGALGTVQASGYDQASTLQWAIDGEVCGGAIRVAPSPTDPSSAVVSFVNVPEREEPYVVIVSVMDGGSRAELPLAVVVRPGLQVQQQTVDTAILASPLTVSGYTYDSTLPSLSFEAQANGRVLHDVIYVAPEPDELWTGLTFEVTAEALARLQVEQPSLDNPSGGIQAGSESKDIVFYAYHPDTLYDSPWNALPVSVTYNLEDSETSELHAGLSATHNPSTGSLGLALEVAYTKGKPRAYTIAWAYTSGVLGHWVGKAPTPTAQSVLWKPDSADVQVVTFTATIDDGRETRTLTAGPFRVSSAATWMGSTALKLGLPQGGLITQSHGKTAWVRATLPDLDTTEGATVTLRVTQLPMAAGHDVDTDPLYTVNIAAGASQPVSALFAVPVPVSAKANDMWMFSITATTTAFGAQSRRGYGQVLTVCDGAPALIITPSTLTPSATAGVPLTPVGLSVQTWVQKQMTPQAVLAAYTGDALDAFLSSAPNAINSTLTPVSGASLALAGTSTSGLPSGIGISDGQIQGTVTQTGTTGPDGNPSAISFSFQARASKSGFRDGLSDAVILQSSGSSPFCSVSWASSSIPVQDGNAQLSWTTQGHPTRLLLLDSSTAEVLVDLTAKTSPQSVPLPGTSALMLAGYNALGWAFTPPRMAQAATADPDAVPTSPVVAFLDSANLLTLNWTPPAVSGAVYDHWVVTAKNTSTALPYTLASRPSTAQLQASAGPGPGNQRTITYPFGNSTAGYLSLQMVGYGVPGASGSAPSSVPWSAYEPFPAVRTATLDKTLADLGEPITVTLGDAVDSTGPEGDRWWVDFGDGTSSNPLPVTITAVPKAYSQASSGSGYQVTVHIASDYVQADGTIVTLVRSYALPTPISVTSAPYHSNPLANQGAPEYQVGGADGTTPALEPYMAVTRALVRDDSTHELKVLLATSRGDNASSQFGTLAADVFPISGRPHTLDLVDVTSIQAPSGSVPRDPLVILTTALEDSGVGSPVTPFQLQARGGLAPYRWYCKDLPLGATLSRDGVLSGTFLESGSHLVTVAVQDSQNPPFVAEAVLPLYIGKSDVRIDGVSDAPGGLVNSSLAPARVGSPYTAYLIASKGAPPYNWSIVAGSLPPGLRLNAQTGAITGLASTNNSSTDFDNGAFQPTFMVTDAVGATAVMALPVALQPMALALGDADQTELIFGVDTLIQIPVMGGKPGYRLNSGSPGLPPGIVGATDMVNGVVRIKIGAGSVVGGGASNSQFSVNVAVTDATGASVNRSYTFTMKRQGSEGGWSSAYFPFKSNPDNAPDGTDYFDSVLFHQLPGSELHDVEVLPVLPGFTFHSPTPEIASEGGGMGVSLEAATVGTNYQVMARLWLDLYGFITGAISRHYTVGSMVYVGVGAARALYTEVHPTPVSEGEFFAFDPQVPGQNASPAPVVFDKAVLAPGFSLPDGVSLDSMTGLIYGTIYDAADSADTVIELHKDDILKARLVIKWSVTRSTLVIRPTTSIPGAVGAGYPDIDLGQPYSASLEVLGTTDGRLVKTFGSPYAASATASGIIHGRIPEGMTLAMVDGVSGGSPSVVLGGRPKESGAFDPVIRVVDLMDPTRVAICKLRFVVDYLPYLNLRTREVSPVVSGNPYAETLVATGGKQNGQGNYQWAVTAGALPAGLTLDPATGVISGTSNAANFDQILTFTVTDTYGQTSSSSIRVVSRPAHELAFETTSIPGGGQGVPYPNTRLRAMGGVPPYTFSADMLPSGLSVDPATGIISGTPAIQYTGTVQLTVTDSQVPDPASASIFPTLVISPSGVPTLESSPSPLPLGRQGHPYVASLVASGDNPPFYGYTVAPNLPSGMTLDSTTGVISGTPTQLVDQDYVFSVTDSNLGGHVTGSRALHLKVIDAEAPYWTTPAGALAVTPAPVEGPSGSPSPYFSFQLRGQDYLGVENPASWFANDGGFSVLSGSLPPGVSLSKTGLISGVATASGLYDFTVRLTNGTPNPTGVVDSVTRSFNLTVKGNLFIHVYTEQAGSPYDLDMAQVYAPGIPGAQAIVVQPAWPLPGATIGQPYSLTFSVKNGTGPFSWSLSGLNGAGSLALAALPGGSMQDRAVAFTTNSVTEWVGQKDFEVQVTDVHGITQTAKLSIRCGANPLTLDTVSLPDGTETTAYSQSAHIQGGVAPYTLNSISGVPAGLSYSFNGSTITFTGTPTVDAVGVNLIRIDLTDSSVNPVSAICTLNVNIERKAYTWESGASHLVGAWTGIDAHVAPLPIGIVWDNYTSSGYSTPRLAATDGGAWLVRITGTFASANPGLNVQASGGLTFTTTLVKAPTPGFGDTAVFAVSFSGSPSAGNITAQATLLDGGVTADRAALQILHRAASVGGVGRGDATHNRFVAGSSLIPLSTCII